MIPHTDASRAARSLARPDPTLFARIGGRRAVERVVDAFYARIESNPDLRPLFPDSLHHGRMMQRLFLEEWFGGEPRYSRRSALYGGMQGVHHRFIISRRQAGRWLHHMAEALREAAVPPKAAAEAMASLGALAHLCVNDGAPFVEVQEALRPAAQGDLAALQERVARQPALLRQKGTVGRTLAWEAARRGHRHVIDWLASRGAPLDEPGGSPVMVAPYALARSRGHEDVAEALLALGGRSDIFTAAYLGDLPLLAAHLHADPRVALALQPSEDVRPVTPLHHAVYAGQTDAARLLLQNGAQAAPYARDLLAWASARNSPDLTRLIKDALA